MARQRFIHPSIWKDPVFGRLTPDEQVMFIGFFSIADDEGRLFTDPSYIRAEIFPYRKISLNRISVLTRSLGEKCRNIHLYSADDQPYAALLKWGDYQRPQYPKPSKIPSPFHEDSTNDDGTFPKPSVVGWVGLGREGLGWVGGDADASPGKPVDKSTFQIPKLKDVG